MIKCEPIRCGSHFSIPKRDLVQKAEVTLLKGIPEKKIKAVGFDVGHTLIQYKNPLNWQGLYRYGLERAAAATGITLSENRLLTAEEVLLRYNTRVNYREWEVDSDCIFGEILEKWDCSADLHVFESAFYSRGQ